MWLKYDSEPIDMAVLVDRDQTAPTQYSYYEKPHGFWITDDSKDSWYAWCVSEGFHLRGLTHKHEVILDEANILIIHDHDGMLALKAEYGYGEEVRTGINWQALATRYDGIIITPYLWDFRMDREFSWYYIWDCASGCIWRKRAIKDVRLISVEPLKDNHLDGDKHHDDDGSPDPGPVIQGQDIKAA